MSKLPDQKPKETLQKIKKPNFYTIIPLNNSEIPNDILERFFPKKIQGLKKHDILYGVYTYEIAETILKRATDYARHCSYTIKLGMKKVQYEDV